MARVEYGEGWSVRMEKHIRNIVSRLQAVRAVLLGTPIL